MLRIQPNAAWIKRDAKAYSEKASRLAMELDDYEFASELLVEMASYAGDSPQTQYDTARKLAGIAVYVSKAGNPESESTEQMKDIQQAIVRKAISYLDRAIKIGFDSKSQIERHTEWDSLRSKVEFQRLVRKLQ